MKHGKFVFGLLILVLASCYLPQNPGNVDGTEKDVQLTVKTDKSRDQGVYVNEEGDSFDIISEEGSDGEVIRCVEAVDIVRVDDGVGAAAKSFGGSGIVKALILGRRSDGYPGVWEVQNDDSILPVSYNDAGEKNSKAGDSCQVEWLMHGFFGWRYHVLKPILGPDSEKGYIFVGYAENTKGVDFGGSWTIEAGTTVAVYWRLEKKHRHFHLSRARIIGEPNEDYYKWNKDSDKDFPSRYRYRHSMFVRFFFSLYNSFKFFFLESFDVYLTDVIEEEYKYDEEQDLYLVTGHVDGSFSQPATAEKNEKGGSVEKIVDKNTAIGTAAITPTGEITITVKGGSNGGSGNGDTYERIVIDTYAVSGTPETDLTLYKLDDEGKLDLKGSGAASGTAGGRIDTNDPSISPLSSGIYYIKVDDKDTTYIGPYAVRVLSLKESDTVPAPDPPGSVVYPDPYEDDAVTSGGVPTKPAPITLGNADYLKRYLGFVDSDPPDPNDVDWLILELP